jgi:hypothetical protein
MRKMALFFTGDYQWNPDIIIVCVGKWANYKGLVV